jgi:mono/diheme cytochrome c family protein
MRHGVRFIAAGLLAAGLACFAISCGNRQTSDQGGSASPPAPAPVNQQGERAFLAYCAMCHGEGGAGDGPLATDLKKQNLTVPAHLSDRAKLDQLGRGGVIAVVENGGAHMGRSDQMPPWGEKLEPALIDSIADYVMVLPDLAAGGPSATLAEYLAAPPGVSEGGRRTFVYYCSGCHGPQGRGDGFIVEALSARYNVRPRDFTDSLHFARVADAQLNETITMGGGHMGQSVAMPAWTYTLTPEQIQELVRYIRVLSRTTSTP